MNDLKRLRKLREAAGLSQVSLGQKTGVSRTRISFAEAGYAALTEPEIAAIRRVLRRELRKRSAQVGEFLKCVQGQQAMA